MVDAVLVALRRHRAVEDVVHYGAIALEYLALRSGTVAPHIISCSFCGTLSQIPASPCCPLTTVMSLRYRLYRLSSVCMYVCRCVRIFIFFLLLTSTDESRVYVAEQDGCRALIAGLQLHMTRAVVVHHVFRTLAVLAADGINIDSFYLEHPHLSFSIASIASLSFSVVSNAVDLTIDLSRV